MLAVLLLTFDLCILDFGAMDLGLVRDTSPYDGKLAK